MSTALHSAPLVLGCSLNTSLALPVVSATLRSLFVGFRLPAASFLPDCFLKVSGKKWPAHLTEVEHGGVGEQNKVQSVAVGVVIRRKEAKIPFLIRTPATFRNDVMFVLHDG